MKLIAAKCPSCGADLPVQPGAPQVTCRFCGNSITIERRAAPTEVRHISVGGAPSRTLYIDPKMQGTPWLGYAFLAFIIGVTVVLPLGLVFGGSCYGAVKNRVHPFPASCALNEELTLEGDWTGNGPILESVATNCKIHIKDAHLKGTQLLKSGSDHVNLVLTLDNVTVDTTDTMFGPGSMSKIHITNSTLTSQVAIFDGDSNPEIWLDGSTLESKTTTAIHEKDNLKLHVSNSKIRGVKSAIEANSNLKMDLKKACEITASNGIAIKAGENLALIADGGKIDGTGGAVVAKSSFELTATGGLALSSSKDKAIVAESSLKLDLTDTSITSLVDDAVECTSSCVFTLDHSVIQGATGITADSSIKIKATKKSRIVGAKGNGLTSTSNDSITLSDSSIEAALIGTKTTSSTTIKLQAGGQISGKRGAILMESSSSVDGTSCVIDGGGGPGVQGDSSTSVVIRGCQLKGQPALLFPYPPTTLDLTGTTVVGGQVLKK